MIRLAALLLAILVPLYAAGQTPPEHAVTAQAIALQTDRAHGPLVALRRDLHAHPELAGQEARTAATVAARLRTLGLEVQIGLYGHSVVGVLRGAHAGRTIAWRAELDALQTYLVDATPFRSQTPGVHHGCGHDTHIAIALGIAEVLAQHRDQLHGNAVFIFQPEEETFRGAKAMLDRGLLTALPIDEIYGVHVTALPVGQIVVRHGEMFAYQRRIRIALKDGLTAAEIEQLAGQVQGALARSRPQARPWEIQRIAEPGVGLTSATTAFQDYLIVDRLQPTRTGAGTVNLEADLYETDAARLASIIPRVTQVVEASGHGGQLLSVDFIQQNPTVLNDPALTRSAMQTIRQAFGADAVQLAHGQGPFFNDDFAYFQQRVPGVYFFLGGSNADKGITAMNHTPNFAVDEESMRTGVKTFATLIASRLGP
ncbi:M20 metallopeptidase family protein [Roseateles sp.]|uniref:M20 metallopeptidase family protein n=1 Tax=Roseateles sp. TaxID=1971397 RepID=UPI003BAB0F0F